MSFEQFLEQENISFTNDEPMSAHTTFHIGGNAQYYLRPSTEEQLTAAVCYCRQNCIRYFVGGNFSNTVFSDDGFCGAVIDVRGIDSVSVDGDLLICGAGVLLPAVCALALREGLSGLEFAHGIPGTVGGALYMNAGAYGGQIADVVSCVRAYDAADNTIVTFTRDQCAFGHRTSTFVDSSLVILSAVFELGRDDPSQIRARMENNLRARKEKQPLEYPSAGSVFKRPQGAYVGQLIESLGMKGERVGGAVVSQKHAGFIVNTGGASCADLTALIEHIRAKVSEAYGILLEPEIRIVR